MKSFHTYPGLAGDGVHRRSTRMPGMKLLLCCAATVIVASAINATTYTFSSSPYGAGLSQYFASGFTNYTVPCAVGPCANYTTAMNLNGHFTTAAPLPPNLSYRTDITAQVTSYSFFDGINTYTNTNPNAWIIWFQTRQQRVPSQNPARRI
jgi:hypothetical protein